MKRFIFLGPPGAGKGTQADFLSKKLSIEHISTGELLRQEIAAKTTSGEKARLFVESGDLVPDEIVIEILKDHISKIRGAGYILDGFPRNTAQAQSLEEHEIGVDKVILFDIDKETVIKRLSGRLYCPACKKFYHEEYRPPKEDTLCDDCHRALIRRKDDDPESIENRIRVYLEQTHPLIKYYEEQGKLEHIDANKEVDVINQELLERIGR
ncbi:MAG TPA: adenylate kinase [Candidatus Mcinerneyibacteriales bacterium]|nr:adenylate kinase [Candidatus Mcinerneyibacteriales bacterium]HPE20792.1 adenylate kinase [Candidatus Mcinerneyibacteriales bacterium]HPJ70550.1 adenylate kinase [Candidatus Mcinerneyibacteriales bacterium]HPQ89038.1 adenylate kinase [Candidatus Mcinerneyibacteriales bacterium]